MTNAIPTRKPTASTRRSGGNLRRGDANTTTCRMPLKGLHLPLFQNSQFSAQVSTTHLAKVYSTYLTESKDHITLFQRNPFARHNGSVNSEAKIFVQRHWTILLNSFICTAAAGAFHPLVPVEAKAVYRSDVLPRQYNFWLWVLTCGALQCIVGPVDDNCVLCRGKELLSHEGESVKDAAPNGVHEALPPTTNGKDE